MKDNWKLKTKRESGINTYIKVDEKGKPVKEKQEWSSRPQIVIKLVNENDLEDDLHKV
jgi:hypothetical protein